MKHDMKGLSLFLGLMAVSAGVAEGAIRPVVILQPHSLYVAEHGTAVFRANIAGGPFNVLVWHMSSPTEGPHIIPDGLGSDVHQMTLSVLDCANNFSYNGLYWLSATNAAGGTITRKVRLTVVPPPRVSFISSDRAVRPGAAVSFGVTPAPDKSPWKHIQWSKDGRVLSDTRVLALRRVRPSDAGTYQCVVTTVGGTFEATVNLTVLP